MKRNLLSIIILALLVVNLALTSIMMLSVTSAAKKTASLVTDIADAIKLDTASVAVPGEEPSQSVAMADTEVYDIADKMTIPLKMGSDGTAHFCQVSVSLSMNKKADGYKEYGADLATKESLIKGEINEAIASYTYEEAQADTEGMRDDILKRVQKLFGSDFIFQVSFRDIVFQ